jgi:hypothetical protein
VKVSVAVEVRVGVRVLVPVGVGVPVRVGVKVGNRVGITSAGVSVSRGTQVEDGVGMGDVAVGTALRLTETNRNPNP